MHKKSRATVHKVALEINSRCLGLVSIKSFTVQPREGILWAMHMVITHALRWIFGSSVVAQGCCYRIVLGWLTTILQASFSCIWKAIWQLLSGVLQNWFLDVFGFCSLLFIDCHNPNPASYDNWNSWKLKGNLKHQQSSHVMSMIHSKSVADQHGSTWFNKATTYKMLFSVTSRWGLTTVKEAAICPYSAAED